MIGKSNSVVTRGLFLTFLALGLLTVLAVLPYRFISAQRNEAKKVSPVSSLAKYYDIRTDTKKGDALQRFRSMNSKNAVSVADERQKFVDGEALLKKKVPTAKVEYNTDIKIPEVITPDVWQQKIKFLTAPTKKTARVELLRNFIKGNNLLVGLDAAQIDGLDVTADYTNPDGNLSYVHLEQKINNIPVFRGEIKAGFTKDNQIIRVINNLAPGLEYSNLSSDFGDPSAAVQAAADNIYHKVTADDVSLNKKASDDLKAVFGEGDWATTAEKMYFPTEPGVAVPAWRVLIWGGEAYYVIVDAQTGVVLWRKGITDDQSQSATYQIYGNPNAFVDVADSPAPFSPGPASPTTGTQGTIISRTTRTLIGNENTLSFNNNGWITDGANVTDGNNVEAGIDRDLTNGVDATQVGIANRNFDSTWNPPPGSPAPGDDPLTAQAQRGSVIQMFYVMNRYHDALYKLGFTEAARNFQANNFARGGTGNDRVSAEGQDNTVNNNAGCGGASFPPCYNNANFSTPADGSRGRMQMYLWSGPTPDYDGTTDAEVIFHEATHGVSNRLHGNGGGLSTNMSGGMGEGWGDFFGEAMLAEPSDAINATYTTGGYATYFGAGAFTGNYYYGIRRFPRAPITFLGPNGKPHNPFTFKYINSNCATLIGTTTSNPPPSSAFPRGPFGSSTCDQVHNIGEIWSSMLWEVRNRMVVRLGFAAGTTRVLQVVMDGMKLAPLAPTMLQERDSIIAASQALSLAEPGLVPQLSADVADVREGFRVRGMGFSASIQNVGSGTNNTAVTEAYDLANAIVTDPFSVTDSNSGGNANGFPEPGETVRLNVPVTNSTGATITNVVVTASGGGNNAANYGNINDGTTVTMPIVYVIPAGTTCGSVITVPFTLTSSVGSQPAVSRSFTVGQPVTTFTQNFDGVVAPALPAGWTVTTTANGVPFVNTTVVPDTAPNSLFAPNPLTIGGSTELTSPSIAVTSAAAQLTFRHRYNSEGGWDGGVLDISIAGGAFQDIITAGGSFVQNGYTAILGPTGANNPIAGRNAWSGDSSGYITSVVRMPAAAAGQNIQLRWRFGGDDNTGGSGAGAVGWNVDTISFAGSFACSAVPTAAGVTVSGRVLTSDGRGLRNAAVNIAGPDGTVRTAVTGPLGYYQFEDVESGKSYVISVLSRRFGYAPRVIEVSDNIADLDFVPEN